MAIERSIHQNCLLHHQAGSFDFGINLDEQFDYIEMAIGRSQ
jgi:hypothetical protein